MELGLKNKNVLITGASRGIGLVTALSFADEGANVSICGRNQDSLNQANKLLAGKNVRVHTAQCDVGDADQLQTYFEEAKQALGGLDILINNATGLGREDDEEGWKKSIDVDLMATVRSTWIATRQMQQRGGGAILHISSIAAFKAAPRLAAYGAIKSALVQMTKTQALQYAPDNIRVNCIAPGSIYVEDGIWGNAKREKPELYQSILDSIPFGRFGTAEEVARVIVFLCSDAASWVTGQTFAVDGAQML